MPRRLLVLGDGVLAALLQGLAYRAQEPRAVFQTKGGTVYSVAFSP
jgi:hypothetical protein